MTCGAHFFEATAKGKAKRLSGQVKSAWTYPYVEIAEDP
jgi:hypothetical protein